MVIKWLCGLKHFSYNLHAQSPNYTNLNQSKLPIWWLTLQKRVWLKEESPPKSRNHCYKKQRYKLSVKKQFTRKNPNYAHCLSECAKFTLETSMTKLIPTEISGIEKDLHTFYSSCFKRSYNSVKLIFKKTLKQLLLVCNKVTISFTIISITIWTQI